MVHGSKIGEIAVSSSQIDSQSVNYYFEAQVGLSRNIVGLIPELRPFKPTYLQITKNKTKNLMCRVDPYIQT